MRLTEAAKHNGIEFGFFQIKFSCKVFTFLFVLSFNLVLSQVVSAQVYQYVDKKGNLCFTDDLSEVPKAKRDKITSLAPGDAESENPENFQPESSIANDKIEKETENEGILDKNLETIPNAEAIEREQKQLERERKKLFKRQQNLKNISVGTMGPEERLEFTNKAEKLNREIEEYEKRRQNFSEKVKNYNKKVRKKTVIKGVDSSFSSPRAK